MLFIAVSMSTNKGETNTKSITIGIALLLIAIPAAFFLIKSQFSTPNKQTGQTGTLNYSPVIPTPPPLVCKRFDSIAQAVQQIDIACGLDLSNKNLSAVPPQTLQLTKLSELILENNRLTTFPVELANLPQLMSLDLSKNQIATIPPEIKNLKTLQILDLSDNKLTSVPSEIGELSSLHLLKLRNNPIPQEEKARMSDLLPDGTIEW